MDDELRPLTNEPDSNPAEIDGEIYPPAASKPFIVGIGASAGGLGSLERLFSAVPSKTGMAFVIIQHLSPDFKSLMDELLARYTDIPIHRAEDGMEVTADSIYLIPPKKDMIIANGRLLLTDKDPKQPLSMPIDRFFRSLAQDAGDRAIGVILSGTGSDGSRGIRDIHDAAGYVVCEAKESAQFDGMPLAALETGVVDETMQPEAIPGALQHYIRRVAAADEPSDGIAPTGAMNTLFKLLNDECGIDFSHYKSNTVGRRIQRRLSMVGAHTLTEYVDRLRRDQLEVNALYRDLLIGVTRFFRDREAFYRLERDVIPAIIDKAGSDDEVRVWVAGCATGEEAYSIGILLLEQMATVEHKPRVKVFATDVHPASLEFAMAGVYCADALGDVSPERLTRYFERRRDGYHVSSELRKMIVFATHNLINDAPFTKLDLITCRNLLIYFDPTAQKRCMNLFHFGLKSGGVLFLGTSETPGDLQDEFDPIDMHWKIYRKSRDVRLSNEMSSPLLSPLATKRVVAPVAARNQPDAGLISAYDAILNSRMPPSLLINERRELLHVFGGAEQHLSVKPGRPSNDVLDLLDHDLRTAVTGAVQRVLKDGRPISFSTVCVTARHGEQRLRVSVEPLKNSRSRLKQLLIVLEAAPERPAPSPEVGDSGDADMRQMSRDRIESLEVELRHNKENLQTTIEELETSNEELQAANEELVTSNEELQSTNEELQSVNEELFTVNAEYQKKITELTELTSDMDNLLAGTDVGTIFLDAELCIRKFTPQIAGQFHLLSHDVGRPIDSFSNSISYPRLIEDLRRVVTSGERFETEVRDKEGTWHLLRILPYRKKAKVDGVVLTLIDVSRIKGVQAELAEAVQLRDRFLAMLSHELRNPLGAILNAANVLGRTDSDAKSIRSVAEVVVRQGQQMARLLDDLLDVSRITQNKIEMRKEPVSMASIAAGAVESVRPLFEQNGHSFTESISDEKMIVDGDSVRLQQAISNLLANAAKYTPPGGRIELAAFPEDGQVVIQVHDNGAGISPDQIDSIFNLFMQSDRTLHRSKGGMGVGLTLVRMIVERHDGTVSVCSPGQGSGSCFEIRLPLMAGEVAAADKAPPEVDGKCAEVATIVVVEDQDDNREMLRRLLEMEGYRVFTAENGPKGVAAVEQHRPDIALVDIGLPGLNGFEVARQIREQFGNRQTYLVALTGYGQPQDLQTAFESGFDSHMVKPLDMLKLKQLLSKARRILEPAPTSDATTS